MVAGVKIPTALATKIPAIRRAVQDLKAYAVEVNGGKENEEATVRAQFHICYHNETPPKPCGDWQEI